nr:immunoglobulin light chain junction region [Macaca mulatta]
CQHSFDTPYSF